VFEETPLAASATGLKLQQVPIEAVQQALQEQQDSNNTETDLGNVDLASSRQVAWWQQDFTLVSWKRKQIAVVDLTLPSDVLSVQL
jgi:hypothetical protein